MAKWFLVEWRALLVAGYRASALFVCREVLWCRGQLID